ncbi:rna binding protein [Plasmopara halstedii]|uniref:Rna binding protein n=1 Tax=Plasmopara halstedii TaxID=4781 RepID=A0A0P1A9U7_PLAHL|nr:rna binding protein [Plasmopara halstedii]CEG37533.1 rna binding protein [Plasmopara halstedii]|eukprot:XP_024573902.1 rna binding protein [Plasmopara halstedii]
MADGNLWRDRNKVFVAGLPPHVDDNALYDRFKSFGPMHQTKVVYDQTTGRSRGFGFLTFSDYTNALDAVDQMNQTKWDHRILNVRFLQPKTPMQNESMPISKPQKVIGPRPENCTTIYVGNLAYDITEEVVRKVFDNCGSIRAIRFAEHIQTKEFRGFAYVQFHEEAACEAAMQLDGMIVMGRPMNVDYGVRDEGYTQAREELQKKLKKGICHKFQSGKCTRGDACKFAHVMQDQDAEELVQVKQSQVEHIVSSEANDAPICINFQKGKCKRGQTCKFQHLQESAKVEKVVVDETNPTCGETEVPVCQNYQKGKCKRGQSCRFRHVAAIIEQIQKVEDPVRVALPVAAVAQVAICRNFQKGSCLRGTSCRFAHTQLVEATLETAVEEVSEYQKRFQSVCYNWQRSKSCDRGEKCPFQHDGAIRLFDEDGTTAEEKTEKGKESKKRLLADDVKIEKKQKKRKKDKKERKHAKSD